MISAANDALLGAWQATLARRRADVAMLGIDGQPLRSFAEIEAEAEQIRAEKLADAAGEVVAIQLGNDASWPAAFLACLRAGATALPLETTISNAERERALAICRATILLTKSSGRIESLRPEIAAKLEWNGRAPAFLKLTSGTTAAPRAVRFRSEQLVADCLQICETMGIRDRDLNFGVIPFSHSYGFSNLVTPLIVRGVPLVVSRERLPRAVLSALSATHATVFPGMPVFYQAFAEMDELPPLPSLRLCISAGAPLPLAVARRFRDRFGHAIHSFYGSSECGGICYDRAAELATAGFVGEPMEGVRIAFLDEQENRGRIEVRSAAVADGYFPNPDCDRLDGARFIPDDLLAPSGSGFQIVGRGSDLINVAGKKVNPAEIEAQLLQLEGVVDAVAFGRESALRNEEVAACAVVRDGITEEAILRHCRERLSGWQVPKRVFLLEIIPVNDRGKISRRELAERFRRV